MNQPKMILLRITGFVSAVLLLFGVWWAVTNIWAAFAALPKEIALALLTAATTVVVTAVTIVAGRFFERKKEFEAVHRDKKIPIYDEFIKNILRQFNSGPPASADAAPFDTVQMFRDWHSQILLWGGPDVVNSYIRWKNALTTSPQTIQVLCRTDELFLAIRHELGHVDRKTEKYAFVGLILRNPELFKAALRTNPKLTMQELADLEKRFDASQS